MKIEGQPGKFDEIVIFQEEHILPKFMVHIVPTSNQVIREIQAPVVEKSEVTNESNTAIKSPSEWNMDDVTVWLRDLQLSGDYNELITSKKIDGKALKNMKEADWKNFGVVATEDQKALAAGVTKLFGHQTTLDRRIL